MTKAQKRLKDSRTGVKLRRQRLPKTALLLAALTVVLSACSSSAPGTKTEVAATTGKLALTITGIPTGATASLAVSGADNFRKTITSSTVLDVKPGTYTVAANTAEINGLQYSATVNGSPATVTANQTATVNVAYSASPVNLSITPLAKTIQPGQSTTLTATVTGAANTAVTWAASAGTLTTTGSTAVFTAPWAIGTYTVTATSVANPARTASATVTAPISLQWVARLDSGKEDRIHDMTTDANGNTFVTGFTQGWLGDGTGANAGLDDVFLAKYDVNGQKLWARQFGSSSLDNGNGIAADAAGNVYVAGYANGPVGTDGGVGSIFLAKYSPQGDTLWIKQFGGENYASGGEPVGIALDADGHVYITGDAIHVFIASFNADGTERWTRSVGANLAVKARAIAVDASGNVYATGYVLNGYVGSDPNGANAGYIDTFLAKYDASGNQQWIKQFGTSGGDEPSGIVVGPEQDVYVSGATSQVLDTRANVTNAGAYDAYLAKFSPAGEVRWVRQYGTNSYDDARRVTVDAKGAVYIAGLASGTITADPLRTMPNSGTTFAAKYAPDGTLLWLDNLGSVHAGGYGLGGLAVDDKGQMVLAGPGTVDNLDGSRFSKVGYDEDAFVTRLFP